MRRVALALLLISHVATAQPAAPVTREFQAGVDAYRLGKLDEAREHLEKARDLDPKLPGPYRFLAAVAQAQGKWADCVDNARKALEANPRSSEAPDTRKLHETCRQAAGRMAVQDDLGDSAAVSVVTNIPGASVRINGLGYGATPLPPRAITAGELEVEIERTGWKPYMTKIEAIPGVVTDINVELQPEEGTQGNELAQEKKKIEVGWLILPPEHAQHQLFIDDAPAEFAERIELSPGTHVVELQAPDHDAWRRRIRISAGQKTQVKPVFVATEERHAIERKGYYVMGAAGVVLAGGFVAAMLSRDAANEARDIVRVERARDSSRPLAETAAIFPVRTREDLRDARDRHARWAMISNVTYAAGLVTAGVGAYFLYKGARQRRDVAPPFAIAPTDGGGMLVKEIAW